MGTHPDGPARLRGTQMELSRFIALNANKEDDCHVRDAIHLPFIMKIMSIRHTLSLQVHPTKVDQEHFNAFHLLFTI
jgi:mannose-6-phosphate isomerase class I